MTDLPEVLYEDADLLAVAKPPGVVVVPARNEDPAGSLRRVLEAARREALWVVHRLDRDTSGVLLFARTAEAHRALCQAFEQRQVDKTYLALTRGLPAAAQGTISAPLHTARKGRMRPAAPGEVEALEAVTDYRVRERWTTPLGPVALVEVRPRTGRQHQVRVHLRWAGAPLLVDPVYGRCAQVTWRDLGLAGEGSLARLALHAWRLDVPHPAHPGRLRLEAPPAADLAALLQALGGSAVPLPARGGIEPR